MTGNREAKAIRVVNAICMGMIQFNRLCQCDYKKKKQNSFIRIKQLQPALPVTSLTCSSDSDNDCFKINATR